MSAGPGIVHDLALGTVHGRFDTPGQEPRERRNVLFDACSLEGREVGVSVLDMDHGPRIAAGCEKRIHDEARHAAVSVRVGVDVAEQPVPEGCTSDLWVEVIRSKLVVPSSRRSGCW